MNPKSNLRMFRTKVELNQILRSKTIFYWSVKHKRMIKLSSSKDQLFKCELCIPKYFLFARSIPCEFSSDYKLTFDEYKNHILKGERHYKRQLIWIDCKFNFFGYGRIWFSFQ